MYSKISVYTFIPFTTHSAHITDSSQVTHFQYLDFRPWLMFYIQVSLVWLFPFSLPILLSYTLIIPSLSSPVMLSLLHSVHAFILAHDRAKILISFISLILIVHSYWRSVPTIYKFVKFSDHYFLLRTHHLTFGHINPAFCFCKQYWIYPPIFC